MTASGSLPGYPALPERRACPYRQLRGGLIESVEPDDATATKCIENSGRHLDAAQKIADLDPVGAYVLARRSGSATR